MKYRSNKSVSPLISYDNVQIGEYLNIMTYYFSHFHTQQHETRYTLPKVHSFQHRFIHWNGCLNKHCRARSCIWPQILKLAHWDLFKGHGSVNSLFITLPWRNSLISLRWRSTVEWTYLFWECNKCTVTVGHSHQQTGSLAKEYCLLAYTDAHHKPGEFW